MPCTTILVGKNASHDGSTIIARNDDGQFEAKRLLSHPAREKASTYKTVISHLTVELPGGALRYTDCPNVTKTNGVWPACGINEANVAMTATETITSNARVIGADPYVRYQPKKGRGTREVPGGIGEEDLVTLVLPYIRSAREGVLRTGALLEQYGTYEPNGMAFADADEVWWLETIGGHHWIARRVPDDRVVVMPNQFGLDHFDFADACGEQKENLCSADLQEFVEKYHLRWIPATGSTRGWPSAPTPTPTTSTTPPRLVHGPVFPAPHLPVGRGERPLHPGKQRHPLVLCAGAQGDGGGCAVSAGVLLPGHALQPLRQKCRLQGQVPHHRGAQQRCVRHSADPRLPARGHPRRGVALDGRQRASRPASRCTPTWRPSPNISAAPPTLSPPTASTGRAAHRRPHRRPVRQFPDPGRALPERRDEPRQQLIYEYDEKIRQGAPAAILEEAKRQNRRHGEGGIDKALGQILGMPRNI